MPDVTVSLRHMLRAVRTLTFLAHAVGQGGMAWQEPHVATDDQGALALDWDSDERLLSLYIREDGSVDIERTLKPTGETEFFEEVDGVRAASSYRWYLGLWT